MKTEPKISNITGIYILIFVASSLDGILNCTSLLFHVKTLHVLHFVLHIHFTNTWLLPVDCAIAADLGPKVICDLVYKHFKIPSEVPSQYKNRLLSHS